MNSIPVAKADEVKSRGKAIVEVNGQEIGIFYVNGGFYAWRNICPHAAAPVCKGTVCGTRLPSMVYEYEYGKEQQILRCPWHGWEFDLTTGRHLADEKVKLKGYEVKIDGESVCIVLPEEAMITGRCGTFPA